MPEPFDEDKELEKRAENLTPEEQEVIEEKLQAEREEKIFKTLRGCNMILVGVITIIIVIIMLVVNFVL